MKRKLAIILNPYAGNDATSEISIKKLLKRDDALCRFYDITQGSQWLNAQLQHFKPNVVVAVGGDGTVRTVAELAVKNQVPMAVIPDGTLNHFAKDLKLPMTIAEAIKLIEVGRTRLVDYAKINGRIFVNNCNLGGYPEAVLKRDELALFSKWLSMGVAFIMTMRRHRKQTYRLNIDGDERVVRAGSLFIGNNTYKLRGTDLSSRPQLDGGELQLVIVKTGRLRHIASIVFHMIRHRHHERIEVHIATRVVVVSHSAYKNVAVDGEVFRMRLPLTVTMHPKGLEVVCS